MTTAVGDPLVVTFSGAVLRVDGPFQLALELPYTRATPLALGAVVGPISPTWATGWRP
jgi:hypothetical protein